MERKSLSIGILVCVMSSLSGCISIEMIPKERAPNPQDPYEPLNRDLYAFNRFMDKTLLKPAAQGYNKIVPGAFQRGISNFFGNLRLIPTVVNDVLQWKWSYVRKDTTRLLINSSIGVFGFYDWATHWGFPPHYEDFGQTLAAWGHTDSAYFVIPFIGPSTLRDGVGSLVDNFYLSAWPYIDSDPLYWSLKSAETIDGRAALLSSERVVESASTDEYAFVRSAYLQRRAHILLDGQLPEDDDDDFYGDDPFADMDE